jgi:hypothetical protein
MNHSSQAVWREWPPTARTAATVIAAALALLAAACGGSPPATSSGGSPAPGGPANHPSALAFARCVRTHGVPNFPDPDSTGHFSKQSLQRLGVSGSQIRAAENPCQNLLPAGPPPLTAPQRQDYLRAAACMRSHGIINFPDPAFADGSVSFAIPSSIDTTSERFIQARQACARFIPAGLPYSGSQGG